MVIAATSLVICLLTGLSAQGKIQKPTNDRGVSDARETEKGLLLFRKQFTLEDGLGRDFKCGELCLVS